MDPLTSITQGLMRAALDKLLEQKANYPLFNSPPSALDTIYPNGTNYNTGMALDAIKAPPVFAMVAILQVWHRHCL